jgi:hypothetical protein
LTLPLLSLSAEASLHGARAAPPWHLSYMVGSRAPGRHFALRTAGAPDSTDFHRDSFSLSRPAQRTVDTPCQGLRPQRLLTSRAHRLRKPHRTNQTSDVLCRWTGAEPRAPRSIPGNPIRPGPRLAVVGLAPQLTRTQDAFRWLDLRPRDRSRLARAPLNVRPYSPRTLLTHRESVQVVSCGPPRQADPGLRNEPRGPLHLPGKMRLPQRLQPTYNTSTSRIAWSSNHRLPRLSPLMAASTPPAGPKP